MTAAMGIELAEFEQDDPGARGEAHGELWRPQIHELCAIRRELLLRRGRLVSAERLDELAARHLPLLAAEAPALADELAGIARGAGVTRTQLVLLNHYTDLRELVAEAREEAVPKDSLRGGDADGCTAVYLPGATKGPVLGQTWDTHASARPYVRLLRIRPRSGGEEVLCFTLTGCLGLLGVAGSGLAIATNTLFTTDGQIGLVWPAVVRTLLAEASAAAARARLARLPLGGGRNVMLADGRDFFGVECSARLQVLMQSGAGAAHLHTNHCFDPVLRRRERVPASSTSFRRMELATTLYVQERPRDAAGLRALLASHEGHPRSLCSHVGEESGDAGGDSAGSQTCGVMVMNLVGGEVLAGAGCAQANPPRQLGFTRWRGLEEKIR